MLAADGTKFDHNWRDFDIVEKAVLTVLKAKPNSPVGVLTNGRKRVTAFIPTDAAFRRLVTDLTGTAPRTEGPRSSRAGLADVDTLEASCSTTSCRARRSPPRRRPRPTGEADDRPGWRHQGRRDGNGGSARRPGPRRRNPRLVARRRHQQGQPADRARHQPGAAAESTSDPPGPGPHRHPARSGAAPGCGVRASATPRRGATG